MQHADTFKHPMRTGDDVTVVDMRHLSRTKRQLIVDKGSPAGQKCTSLCASCCMLCCRPHHFQALPLKKPNIVLLQGETCLHVKRIDVKSFMSHVRCIMTPLTPYKLSALMGIHTVTVFLVRRSAADI